MVSAKLCLALALCILAVAGTTEAHGKAHAKSAQAREEIERAEHAQNLRNRLEVVARITGAIMSQGEGDNDPDADAREADLNTCLGGYMTTRCSDDGDAKSARNGL